MLILAIFLITSFIFGCSSDVVNEDILEQAPIEGFEEVDSGVSDLDEIFDEESDLDSLESELDDLDNLLE